MYVVQGQLKGGGWNEVVVGANREIGVRTFGGGGNYIVVVAHVGR